MPEQELKQVVNRVWPGISETLQGAQTILTGVYRWSKYADTGIRRQDDLQHSYSITLLASIFINMLNWYNPLVDQALVLNAFLVHDYGEGLLDRGICLTDKVKNDDLDEYNAFVGKCSALDKKAFEQLHKAYLLQYAIEERPDFPSEGQEIINSLRATRMIEILIFRAVETWEYILYALEQHNNGHQTILAEVMGNAKQRLVFLSDNLPGFKEVIWTREIAEAFQQSL